MKTRKIAVAIPLLFALAGTMSSCAASAEEQALEKLQDQAREAVVTLEEQQKTLDQLGKRPWYGMYVSCDNKIQYGTENQCVQKIDEKTRESLQKKKEELQKSVDEINKEFIDISIEDVQREAIPAMGIDYFDVIEEGEKQIKEIVSKSGIDSARSIFTKNIAEDIRYALNADNVYIFDPVSQPILNADFLPLIRAEKILSGIEEVDHGWCNNGEDSAQLADFQKSYREMHEYVASVVTGYNAEIDEQRDFNEQIREQRDYISKHLEGLSDKEFDQFYTRYIELANTTYDAWWNVKEVHSNCLPR